MTWTDVFAAIVALVFLLCGIQLAVWMYQDHQDWKKRRL